MIIVAAQLVLLFRASSPRLPALSSSSQSIRPAAAVVPPHQEPTCGQACCLHGDPLTQSEDWTSKCIMPKKLWSWLFSKIGFGKGSHSSTVGANCKNFVWKLNDFTFLPFSHQAAFKPVLLISRHSDNYTLQYTRALHRPTQIKI